jgi:toxin FitB
VTRYLLDTNILSEATKPQPSEAVIGWLGEQVDSDLFISTLTLAEIWRGILEKPAGRKRRDLNAWFDGPDGPRAIFMNRILPFDEAAALEWSRIMARGKVAGRPRSALDMIIAATAAINDCAVVTLNERHFEGVVEVLNPKRIVG